MTLGDGLLFLWVSKHGEGRRGIRPVQLPTLGGSGSRSDTALLPDTAVEMVEMVEMVETVDVHQRGGPGISFWGSRALGEFVPVVHLHLDEGKLFLVWDAIWLCCRSGTAA